LVTVSVALEGSQQLVHFGLGQVLPDPVDIVPPASFLSDWSHYDTFWPAEAMRFCLIFPPSR
jgi:hypothetical protein